jgi:RHS repeat-associated protein
MAVLRRQPARRHILSQNDECYKERDSESGLDNFGARYNSSNMGRFMSPDPMGGHPQDPQTLNRYAYVRNNPLNLTDPTGLDFYLRCSGKDSDTCQGGRVGTTTTDDEGRKTFTATVVTSDSIPRLSSTPATCDEIKFTAVNRRVEHIADIS